MPHLGPQRFLAPEVAARSALWSVEPNMVKGFSPFLQAAPVAYMPLYAVTFGSLQHFLCSSCRGPADVGSALNPGASPTCQQGLKVLKGEPESPQTATPEASPDSPARSSCQPNSPAESNTCNKNLVVRFYFKKTNCDGLVVFLLSFDLTGVSSFLQNDVKTLPDPKACNWKKYKYIVLNPLCAATSMSEEQLEEGPHQTPLTAAADRMMFTPITPTEAWSGEVPGQIDR